MCVGVPVEIIRLLDGEFAEVKIGGASKKINISLIDKAAEGEYVILHAGFAINRISVQDAIKTYEMLKNIENGERLDPAVIG